MDVEFDYCGQYTARTIRSYYILCVNHDDCHNMAYVNAIGDIPDGWENLSRWGFDRIFCPDCKRKTHIKCVDPDVRSVLDMMGAPYELDYVHRRAYEYRFDQRMKSLKELREARRVNLADLEGSVCGSN